jgi:hypothetical protein
MIFNSLGKRNQNALDDIHGVACVMVAWARYRANHGWVYPNLVGPGDYCHFDPSHLGSKGNILTAEKSR